MRARRRSSSISARPRPLGFEVYPPDSPGVPGFLFYSKEVASGASTDRVQLHQLGEMRQKGRRAERERCLLLLIDLATADPVTLCVGPAHGDRAALAVSRDNNPATGDNLTAFHHIESQNMLVDYSV
jgi:hypothetical protein